MKVPAPLSSSASSAESVGLFVAAVAVGESGLVGGARATVALGSPTVAGPAGLVPPGSGAFAVFSAMVGAPTGALVVASLMVGAPVAGGAPAVLRGIVGAGAGALGAVGAPAGLVAEGGVGAVGAPAAVGGLGGPATGAEGGFGAVGGLAGRLADGTAGGASAALSVTLTVSFFKGTLEVCLDGGLFSFSLILGVFAKKEDKVIPPQGVKHASLDFFGNLYQSPGLICLRRTSRGFTPVFPKKAVKPFWTGFEAAHSVRPQTIRL